MNWMRYWKSYMISLTIIAFGLNKTKFQSINGEYSMNNSATIGYMILAARKVGLQEKEIKAIEREMQLQMDCKTEGEAEVSYRNF